MKRRKRTNKSVPAKGRLRDMADRLWSLAVRADWYHRCAVCGYGKCESHHLIPRQHETTRYKSRNGIALCSRHHQFDPDTSPHQNAAGWLLWLSEHCPELHKWYVETTETGEYRTFSGTKTADYYIGIIRGLREYVDPEQFIKIVGVTADDKWLKEDSS